MFIRKLGGIVRGKATPMQVVLACLLGGLIGFVPVVSQAPGLMALYVVLLLVLNANLGLALLVGLVAKLLSLAAMPLSFEVGRVLIEGPARGLVEAAVNAPVLALFGLEYYATTGGIVVGAVLGLVLGLVAAGSVTAFRKRMAGLEQGSEKYKKVAGKGWSRFLMWLLVGGRHGKLTYAEMLDRGKGKPIRIAGVIVAALLLAGFYLAPSLVGGSVLAGAAKSGLQGWNGATVDLAGVELSTAESRLVLTGLAMADPEALDTDVFRASRLEADVSGSDLLRARMVIDTLLVHDGQAGAARQSPGELFRTEVEVDEPESTDDTGGGLPDLGQLPGDLEQWRQRIETIKKWVERLTPEPSEEQDEGPGAVQRARERLEREVAEKGYARVDDRSLERDSPRLLIRHLEAGGVRLAGLDDQVLDIQLFNFSTSPALVAEKPRLVLKSRDGSLDLDIVLDEHAGDAVRAALEKALLGPAAARLDAEKAKLEAKQDEKLAELDQKKNEKVDEAKGKLDEKVGDALGGLFGGKEKPKKPKDGDG